MELSSQEAEIPMPINSVYGGVHAHGHGHSHAHMTHHHHHQHQHHYHHDDQEQVPSSATSHDHNNINPSSSSSPQRPTNIINNGNVALNLEDHDNDCNNNTNSIGRSNSTTTKKLIKFRECQKNHAASMGGNATDGCGEFMPSGEEGTLEALTCSACNCHRNFHRKEILGEHRQQYPPHAHRIYLSTPHHQPHRILSTGGRKVILGGGSPGASGGVGGQGYLGYPTGVGVGVGVGAGTLIPMSRALPINVPYQVGPSATPSDQSDDHDHDHDHHQMVRPPHQLVKKRFRTKFSQEQKEKMLAFAEKVGWKIQKQEENVVQQFCQEIGVKRRVLKVWMHNNKHTLAKKSNPNSIDNNNNINPSLL